MNKKEIQIWIAESKKKGYNQAQIEEELKKHGYSTGMINNALNKNNKGNGNKIIITLAILVILILGMTYYFAFYRPSTLSYQLDKAESLEKAEKPDEAIAVYHKILEKYPNTPAAAFANSRIGEIYFNKVEYDLAIPYFKNAIELNPENRFNSYYRLGQIYNTKGDFSAAIYYLNESLKISEAVGKKLYRARFAAASMMGEMQLNKGYYSLGIEYLKIAYSLQPENIKVNYNLGTAYYLNEEYGEAEVYFNNYLSLNPSSQVGIETVKNYLKAIEELKKSV